MKIEWMPRIPCIFAAYMIGWLSSVIVLPTRLLTFSAKMSGAAVSCPILRRCVYRADLGSPKCHAQRPLQGMLTYIIARICNAQLSLQGLLTNIFHPNLQASLRRRGLLLACRQLKCPDMGSRP